MKSKNSVVQYVVIPILLLVVSFPYAATSLNVSTSLCIEEERVALLQFRNDLKDAGNCLSSWVGKHCCDWAGIQCDNQTGHVLMLDLQNSHICTNLSEWSPLSGELNPSLTYLKRLSHLDLSDNDFQGLPIPKFIGSLSMLRYLHLSFANFSGMVPSQIGNLSDLQYLDISGNDFQGLPIPKFIGSLSMLRYLHLSFANFSGMVPSQIGNLSDLQYLDISGNDFQGLPIPKFIGSLSMLRYLDLSSANFCGMVPPQIGNLPDLQYLDISDNDFQGLPIPKFIGSLSMLRYLDLSNANFSGMVPSQIGNLSDLQHLGISGSSSLWVGDISWLSLLISLQYLRMDYLNITSTTNELFRVVNMIPSLLELHLSGCNLSTLPPSFPFENITSLSFLDLSDNPFNSDVPSWLFNMSALTELKLEFSSLRGPFSAKLGRGNLCKLQTLHLSFNENLTGDITEMLEALSCGNRSLSVLDLSSNQLTGKLPNSLRQFNNLSRLDLSSNSLSGPIPASIGNLSSLDSLNLGSNMMNGEIPESIGQLTDLSELSLLENNWQGRMTHTHFHNLTMLYTFSVSSKNSSFALKVAHDWVPPFTNLDNLEISDCQVGSAFPNWLRNMSLSFVILENVGISEEIPIWLFNMSSDIDLIVLSQNKISGYLPKALNFSSEGFFARIDLSFNQLKGSIPRWSGVGELHLRNNLFSGTIPVNIGKEMPYLEELDLSNNYLSGSIPLSINRLQNLFYLDLSNNYLTGKIPIHWMRLWSLQIINLSNNSFSGGIPTSTCSSPSLSILDLSNNNLSANLSLAFQNCTRLNTLVLSKNKFFGSIPKEIHKNIPFLSELLLRGNTLNGTIAEDLCRLPSLHVLDLAENRISGSIPACLGDLQGYKLPQTNFIFWHSFYTEGVVTYEKHTELVLKGRIMDYFNQMLVQSIIDVSRNDLTGEIPEKLTELVHLGALNLSWNHLTGNIPSNIGSLTDLESLDLSQNHLSGPIPPSMTSLTFLSYLNLSYNNLSGQIPVANQFETFTTDPSIYVGNPHLCGTPLPNNCSTSMSPGNGEQKRRHEQDESEGEDKTERLWLYASIAFGYMTGFWAVCGSLMLKRSWRHAYFNFMYDLRDELLVFIAVNLARAKRRFGLERQRAQT